MTQLSALRSILVVLAGVLLWAATAHAQCRDFRGVPVAFVPMLGLPDVAAARLGQMGEPVVLYNPAVLNMLKPQTRDFFYFHECAHHVLGHSLGMTHPLAVEQQADCWAVAMLTRVRGLTPTDLAAIQSDIGRSPGDWTHLPGFQRALNLIACRR